MLRRCNGFSKVRVFFFFFKQKTAYEMRISDWSSDVCSSDLKISGERREAGEDCEVPVRERQGPVSLQQSSKAASGCSAKQAYDDGRVECGSRRGGRVCIFRD